MPLLRALALLLSVSLLAACVTAAPGVSAKSEKFRNARAAATPVVLGTAY